METITNAIGDTPMIRIDYIHAGVRHCLYAKLESYNLTGSIKDRMAAYVLDEARKRGELRKAQPIVEVTSGNTGISLSAIGGSLGHAVHIFIPDWASMERMELMKMYGAVLHPVSREEGGFLAAMDKAACFAAEIGAYRPRQFENPDNAWAHYHGTGAEILRALPEVDGFAAGVGSGGTLMGVGRRLREDHPVWLAAVEPAQAPMLTEGRVLCPHRIEGIGDDFIPALLDRHSIDHVYDIDDRDAVNMARLFARELGLGIGISSGANFLGAVCLKEEQGLATVATTFADDNKKYISTTLHGDVETDAQLLSNRLQLLSYERL